MRRDRRDNRFDLTGDDAKGRFVFDGVFGERSALAIHVDRVPVEIRLTGRRIQEISLDARGCGLAAIVGRLGLRHAGFFAVTCRFSQRLSEVEVPGHEARRIRVRDVAGDETLALRPQHQRLSIEVQSICQSIPS